MRKREAYNEKTENRTHRARKEQFEGGSFLHQKGEKKRRKVRTYSRRCAAEYDRKMRAQDHPRVEVRVSHDHRNSSVLILKSFRDGNSVPLSEYMNEISTKRSIDTVRVT